jgi:ATP-binding cassette subfamily B protein
VGRTGSGKTTLTRLLVRLWDVDGGSVQVGSVDVRQVERATLRRRIGAVIQEPQLFNATLRDNLTLFDPQWEDAQISAALVELGLDEWVAGLPHGLETLIGPDGRGLSAGEAQLVALARVFLGSPDVVVLDEPSALLDAATERLVNRAIGRLLAGRTGLIVAHRLTTLQRTDSILVLDNGAIVEQGPRAELAARRNTRFSQLLRGWQPDAVAPV